MDWVYTRPKVTLTVYAESFYFSGIHTWGDVNTHHLPLVSCQGLERHPSWMGPDLGRVVIGGGYDVARCCAWREGGRKGGREGGREEGREGGRGEYSS